MKGLLNGITREAAVDVAAGIITIGVGAAVYYKGGGALLVAAAIIGGGICAAAVTHQVAKTGLIVGLDLVDRAGKAIETAKREREERAKRPAMQAEARAAAVG